MAIVYQATNLVNGKRYIGVTRKTIGFRRSAHHKKAMTTGAQSYFHRAIRKYGKEQFKWEIIESHDSYDVTLQAEIRLIAERKPEYNMSSGGEAGFFFKPETIERMAAVKRGKKASPETRAKISDTQRGKKRPPQIGQLTAKRNKERVWTDEARDRVGKIWRGVKQPNEMVSKRREKLIGKKRTPEMRKAASDRIKSDQTKMDQIRALGLMNSGCERPNLSLMNRSPEHRAKVSLAMKGRPSSRAKMVICVTDGITYPSGAAAAQAYGLHPTQVNQVCANRKHRKSAGGLVFKYIEKEEKYATA